jgi:hypothetical protein
MFIVFHPGVGETNSVSSSPYAGGAKDVRAAGASARFLAGYSRAYDYLYIDCIRVEICACANSVCLL